MKTYFQIQANLFSDNGILPGSEEFMRRYALYRIGSATIYRFSVEKVADEAQSFLQQLNAIVERFYVFELSYEEELQYPSIYLGLHEVLELFNHGRININIMDNWGIVHDYATNQIVATSRVKSIFDRVAHGVTWKRLPSKNYNQCFVLDSVDQLPDPIIIPSPMFVGKDADPATTYAVRSDGRDIVTENNLRSLFAVGLATSSSVRAASDILSWRQRLIASGRVIHALRVNNVKGLLYPLPLLLTKNHPLVIE